MLKAQQQEGRFRMHEALPQPSKGGQDGGIVAAAHQRDLTSVQPIAPRVFTNFLLTHHCLC